MRLFLLPVLGSVLLGVSAQAACSTPFFPVKEGLTRQYQMTVGGKQASYTEKITGVKAGGFTQTTSFDGQQEKMQIGYLCDAGGIRVSAPAMHVKSFKQTGVNMPSSLKVGSNWTTTTSVKMDMGGQSLSTETRMNFKVVGREQVKVKAGTFNAFKLEMTGTTKTLLGGKPSPHPAPPMKMTSWVVENVGTVKSVTGDTVAELVKYSR